MHTRSKRETVIYRGASGAYFGFTIFSLGERLPRAAGLYALAERTVGPEPWRIHLLGDTSNIADQMSVRDCRSTIEAQRRGATHIMLHVSPITTIRRREAGHDLWRRIRAPLVAWDSEDVLRRA